MKGVSFARNARAISPLLLLVFALRAWGNHPLISEDTDVLGAGVREFEAHGERARGPAGARASELSAKLGYGVSERVDVEVELGYLRERSGSEAVEGAADTALALKWRFHEGERLSLALKPVLLLPTGREEEGLGAGRARWAVNLAAGYEIGRWQLLGHLGYTDNRNRIGERRDLWHASAALRWSVAERLKLIVDLGRDSDPDAGTAARELVYGLSYALADDVDLGLGVKRGLNDAAADRALRAGIKLRW